jgi:SagB-type dehydrogenase family enzyme
VPDPAVRALRQDTRLRRAHSLALSLDGSRLVVEEVLSHRRHEINDDALTLLRSFDRWRTTDEVAGHLLPYSRASIRHSAELLLRKRLLVARGTPEAARQARLRAWQAWGPAATCYHFASKDTRFAETKREVSAVVRRVTRVPMPSIYKDLPGPRARLPAPEARLAPGSLGKALLERRTCREFLPRPLPRRLLEAATTLSFGRLGLIDAGPYGTLLHRSAPSGGGRHPIECYVMALDVSGLPRGLYHYSVRENALVRLSARASREDVRRFTHGQAWFSEAAAVFLLTAVFERTMWKYRTPRGYRIVLLDAAHACQNLLLAATSLRLGAFAVAALDESAIDRYLGIDGISEGSLYAAGIGWPDTKRIRAAMGPDGRLPGGPG